MWIVHGVSAEDKAALAEQFGGTAEAQNLEMVATPDPVMQARAVADLLRNDPAFESYGASVTITAEPDLVRINLTDMAERPLFETGDGKLNETGQTLTRLAGQAIAILPFSILIEGHTDSNPSLTSGYSNWELSADRANSARRLLMEAGVSEHRIKGVAGLADTQPLLEDAPEQAANRRISIVLVINENSA